ncbi:MAG: LacI family DNA-binding transcriptional regulator [Opitutaceae bacterium]|nr:LacI family DNA-binding transcriptional regulator [Opitutaceae bacterium]
MPHTRDFGSIRSTADFARYVGLARTTVSRVLNGHPGVKRSTIERVQRALEQTGFTPNAFAVGLRGKGAAVAGICMENLLTPPMVAKLALLQKRLRARGFTCLIEVLAAGESRKVVQHFQAMQASAVIFIGHFVPAEIAQRVAELRRRKIAHVLIDQANIAGANSVSFDRAGAMHLVMNHLLDLGHRSFGLLGMDHPEQQTRDRLRGITEALTARGLDPAAHTRSLDHLEPRDNDFTFGRALARAFARLEKPPTALVGVNDEVAIGAMLALEEMGMKVPDAISVTGFNNQDICQMTSPNVTSVDQQVEATIEIALDLLEEQLEQISDQPVVRMIRPTMIARQSSGPVPRRAT